MRLRKITIVGVGLARRFAGPGHRKRRLAGEVVGFVRRAASVAECRKVGAVDRATHDLLPRCRRSRPDRPVHAARADAPAGRANAPGAEARRHRHRRRQRQGERGAGTRIVDREAGGAFCRAAIRWRARKKPAWPRRAADLFVNAVCVVTPTRRSNEAAVRKVEAVLESRRRARAAAHAGDCTMRWSAGRVICRTSWPRRWRIWSSIPRIRKQSGGCCARTVFATRRALRPARRRCGGTSRWPTAESGARAGRLHRASCRAISARCCERRDATGDREIL